MVEHDGLARRDGCLGRVEFDFGAPFVCTTHPRRRCSVAVTDLRGDAQPVFRRRAADPVHLRCGEMRASQGVLAADDHLRRVRLDLQDVERLGG